MLNDASIDKIIIYVLLGIIAVLAIAVIYLAVKKNTYYVDDDGDEIQSNRKRPAAPSYEEEYKPETIIPKIDPAAPAIEETAVVSSIRNMDVAAKPKDEIPTDTKEVPLDVKAAANVTAVKVRVDVNGQVNEHVIDLFPCLIGRESSACDLTIPEPAVSRRHAEFVTEGSKLFIKDVSEHNGTYVNQTKLPSLGKARLYDGDEIALGRAVILIEEIIYE